MFRKNLSEHVDVSRGHSVKSFIVKRDYTHANHLSWNISVDVVRLRKDDCRWQNVVFHSMYICDLDGKNDATRKFFTYTYRTSIKHIQVYGLANLLSNVMMDEALIKLTFVVL
jgi:hypothetical protein